MRINNPVTQHEYLLPDDATLMSTTDTQSYITYANSAFIKSSGFSDVKYLNKMLKDRYNMTALKYRKRLTSICTQESQPCFMTDFIEELRVCLKLIEEDQPFSATYGLNPNV